MSTIFVVLNECQVSKQEPDVQWLSFVDVVHKCFSFLVYLYGLDCWL